MFKILEHIPYDHMYCNDPKFLDRQVWTYIVDPDQTAPDQGLHCLPFHLHLLNSFLYVRATVFKF